MTTVENQSSSTTVDADVLVERARALKDTLRAHAAEADENRRLNQEDVDAITAAGLTSLTVPRRFGGSQTSVRTFVDVTRTLGQGDISAGWLAGVHNAGAFVVSLFPEETQQEVWADGPTARVAGVLSPSGRSEAVEGGIRLSGRWPYMSGIVFADWVFVVAPIGGELGPDADLGFVLARRSDIRVDDTWFMTGMRATASQTAVFEDVFIPERQILRWRDYRPGAAPDLYRSNVFQLLFIALAGPTVGEAEYALEIVSEKALTRPITTTTYRTQADSAAFQVALGRAAQTLQTARLFMDKAADDMDRLIAQDVYPSTDDKAATRADTSWAADTTWQAVDALVSAYGTSAFVQNTPLERIWRNSAVVARHAGFSERAASEIYGRALLGLDPNAIGPTL